MDRVFRICSHAVVVAAAIGVIGCGDDRSGDRPADADVPDADVPDAGIPDAGIPDAGAAFAVKASYLAAGNHFSVIRDPHTGAVSTMGENGRAQLGMSLIAPDVPGEYPYPVPRVIALPVAEIAAVYAGELHSAAIDRRGDVYTWGLNNVGATGLGASAQDPTVANPGCSALPTGTLYDNKPDHHICTASRVQGLTRVVKLAPGNGFTIALTAEGRVWSWGNNASGQLGLGNTTRVYAPVQVSALAAEFIVDIAAGNSHVLALTRDGRVLAWGGNRDGQLGQGPLSPNPINIPSPVLVTGLGGKRIVALGTSNFSSFAITDTSELLAWGENDFGQLGIGSFDNDQPTPVTVALAPAVQPVAVAGGSRHAYLLTRDGDVFSWGCVGEGQLGNGRVEGASAEYVLTPQKIAALDAPTIVELIAAPGHTLARSDTGVIYGWGSNGQGRLALGSTFDLTSIVSIPVPIDLRRSITTAPTHAASGLTFTDVDPGLGTIGGTLLIHKAASEEDVDGYTVYWASDFGDKLADAVPLLRAVKTGTTLTISIAGNTAIPAAASHLLVLTRNHLGEMRFGPSIALIDHALPPSPTTPQR
jgi:alpha-tubulin suppressor-like RCC1 family protein